MESINNVSDWPICEEEKNEYLTLPDQTTSQLINLDSGNYVQINHINNNPVTDLKWPQDEFTWQYCNEQFQPQIQEQQVFYDQSAHQQHFYYNQNGQEETQQINLHDLKVPISNINYEHLNNRSVASTSGTQQYNYNIDFMQNNNMKLEPTQQQFLYIGQQKQHQWRHQPELQQQQQNYQVIVAPMKVAPLRAQTVSPADSAISSTTVSSSSSSASSSNACTTSQGKNSRVNCPKCDRTFAKQCYLKQHQKTAHAILPFHCKKCGKKFLSQQLLDNHIDRHNAIDKPYKCEFILENKQCEKQFFHSSDLRRHMMGHNDNKPHACHICKKNFTRKDHMVTHTMTHRKN